MRGRCFNLSGALHRFGTMYLSIFCLLSTFLEVFPYKRSEISLVDIFQVEETLQAEVEVYTPWNLLLYCKLSWLLSWFQLCSQLRNGDLCFFYKLLGEIRVYKPCKILQLAIFFTLIQLLHKEKHVFHIDRN